MEKIRDIGEDEDGIHIQIQWVGLPHKKEWTWVPLKDLYEDAPVMLTEFINNCRRNKKLLAKAKRSLHIS